MSCDNKPKPQKTFQSFNELLVAAKGTTVSLYGWGGDEKVNRYFDTILAPVLLKKYKITLKRVPMLPNEYLNKIGTEVLTKSVGNADIVWINGVNFKTAKEQKLLFGPMTLLENYKNLNLAAPSLTIDYGISVDQMEVPFGHAQFILISNQDYKINTPEQLRSYIKTHPGRFTYPNPNDFTGAAFIRNLIYGLNIDVSHLSDNKEILRNQLRPLFNYLKEIEPYLWAQGKSYPADIATLDREFANGVVDFTMNYNPFHVYAQVAAGLFPKTTHSFIFEQGSTADTHFMAIPINAPNIAGAEVVINEMISVEMQFDKFNPLNWGDLPVIDPHKLTAAQRAQFASINFGENSMSIQQLNAKALPEFNAHIASLLVDLWTEEVLHK